MSGENQFAGQGPVLLDIGGDVGALVIRMPPETAGWEVEIRPAGHHPVAVDHPEHRHGDASSHGSTLHDHDHDHGPVDGRGRLQHVAVVPRPVDGGYRHSAVFPELAEGDYELYRRPAGRVELQVTIAGGRVTDAVWPDRA